MKLYPPVIALILFSFFTNYIVAQKLETNIKWLTTIPDAAEKILYHPKHKLTIEDFKGTPDAGTDAVAITASGLMFTAGYHSQGDNATLSIGVYCSFNKKESWMKEKGKNAYILEHEQRHFDISYLSAVTFIKKLQQAKFKQGNYMEQVKVIYQDIIEKMELMQNKYDSETGNGTSTEKQAAWNEKINRQLADAAGEQIL